MDSAAGLILESSINLIMSKLNPYSTAKLKLDIAVRTAPRIAKER